MRTYLSILALLFFSLYAMGQDKLTTRNGETFEGNVELLAFEGEMPYAIVKNGKEKSNINFFDIKEINKEGMGTVRTMKIGSEFKFVLLVKEGFLSLYRYSTSNRTDDFGINVIQKFGSESLPIPGIIGFRNQMADYLSECRPLSKKIETKELKRKDLDLIVEEYNSCIAVQQSEKAKVSPQVIKTETKISSSDQSLINDFVTLLKYSEKVDDKEAVTEMFSDLTTKINAGQKLPDYLVNALKSAVAKDDKLSNVLNKIIKQ